MRFSINKFKQICSSSTSSPTKSTTSSLKCLLKIRKINPKIKILQTNFPNNTTHFTISISKANNFRSHKFRSFSIHSPVIRTSLLPKGSPNTKNQSTTNIYMILVEIRLKSTPNKQTKMIWSQLFRMLSLFFRIQ